MKLAGSFLFLLCGVAQAICLAGPPTSDPSMDSILGLSQKPTTQPAAVTQPVADVPLKIPSEDDQSRSGEITLSDGTKISGKISTTIDKPIRIWVEKEKNYEDVLLDQVASAEAIVVWERDEKEWNFKETGSDIKVYSGKTYPARQTQYKFTLSDGTIIQGDVVVPLYVTTVDGRTKTYVLNKRDKGEIGQTLAERAYVKLVILK